jgi:hypothetical protein
MSEDAPVRLDLRTEAAIAGFHRSLKRRLAGGIQRTAKTSHRAGLRILVTGGRSFDDVSLVLRVIAQLPETATVVHGAARGADILCAAAAANRGLRVEAHRADWRRFSKGAGPERNQRMLNTGIHLVLAFPGAAGTGDCVRRARKAGIPVVQIEKLKLGEHVVPEALR